MNSKLNYVFYDPKNVEILLWNDKLITELAVEVSYIVKY